MNFRLWLCTAAPCVVGAITVCAAKTGPLRAPSIMAVAPNLTIGPMAPIFSIGGTQNKFSAPGEDTDAWVPPHALVLGAQRVGAGTSTIPTDLFNSGGAIVLRGTPDGYLDLGALISAVTTDRPVFETRAGLSSNLTSIPNIANDGSFDTVISYHQPQNFRPRLVLKGVTYDATHIYLPKGSRLTAAQIAMIHPNQYVTTNSIDPNIAQPDIRTIDSGVENPIVGSALNPHNFFVSTVASVAADGTSITVNGWGILGGNTTGHPWNPKGDIPGTTYDKIRGSDTESVAMIGSPTQTGDRNVYMKFDPVEFPDSRIDAFNGDEFDIKYDGDKSNEATMRGIVIAFNCEGAAAPTSGACYHPSYESVGLQINGPNLPNGIINMVPGWANEYKGYNFYIPGSRSPALAQGATHTSFESITPTYMAWHQLIFRTWTRQTNATSSPNWTDYSLNQGLVIDGAHWNSSATTGTQMGRISYNYNGANLGGVCLIGNSTTTKDTNTPGLCVRGDGSVWSAGSLHMQQNDPIIGYSTSGDAGLGATLLADPNGDWRIGSHVRGGGNLRGVATYFGTSSQIPKLENVAFIRSGSVSTTFESIIHSPHKVSDRVWCGNCRNARQRAGAGSGRWIFLDSAATWRSDDGFKAKD